MDYREDILAYFGFLSVKQQIELPHLLEPLNSHLMALKARLTRNLPHISLRKTGVSNCIHFIGIDRLYPSKNQSRIFIKRQ